MPADDRAKRWGFTEPGPSAAPRAAIFPVVGLALLAACGLATGGEALAQQTVIIGGGPGGNAGSGSYANPPGNFGSPGTIGGGGSGIVVNDSALDALGPGVPTSNVPMAAPRMPVEGFGFAPPASTAGVPQAMPGGTAAYRLPGTGELVVTRPSTLLYPPMTPPRSRLTVPRTQAAAMAKPAAPAANAPGGKLTSRLIAKPPLRRLPETSTAPETTKKSAAAAASKPAMAPRTPVQAVQAPVPAPVEPPAPAMKTKAASVPAPPPPSLTGEMPAKSAAPAPRVAVPKAPVVAAPSVAPPKVAAPAAPKAASASSTAAPAMPSAPAKVQKAARTTGVTSAGPDGGLRLSFTEGSAELSEAAKEQLQDLAQSLTLNVSRRVQLLAYAAEGGEGASRARRLSLSRALAVRAFLIDRGVRSTRMDVRALGNKAGDGPADRVDVLTP